MKKMMNRRVGIAAGFAAILLLVIITVAAPTANKEKRQNILRSCQQPIGRIRKAIVTDIKQSRWN